MDYVNTFTNSFESFFAQLISVIPMLILAYIIWLVGKWLIDKAAKWIDYLDIKELQIDDQVRGVIKKIFVPVAKIILILVILDTLGIGSNVVQAVINGLTFTIAIALGLAFGKALEPEANQIKDRVKNRIK